jgi:hypothetical protein
MAMKHSITSYEEQVMKPEFDFWMFKPKSSQSSEYTHIQQKAEKV